MAILSNKDLKSEGKNSEKQVVDINRNSGFLRILLLLTLVASIGFSIVFYFQNPIIRNKQVEVEKNIAALNDEIAKYSGQNIEETSLANELLENVSKEEIKWSEIISAVDQVKPANVTFLSYSGAADGKLTLSAVTKEDLTSPYANVSELIKVFNNSAYFKDGFVPSISKGSSVEGGSNLGFTFNVNFVKSSLGDFAGININNTNSGPEKSPVKVPRSN